MKITVTGLDRAIKRVNRLVGAGLERKCEEIARRLCVEVGLPQLQAVHGNHAKVDYQKYGNGYMIYAKGKDVLFIEFGTGDMAGVMDSLYHSVPSEVGQGTWSATHAQMYTRYGFWVFANQIYHYTEPHPAFYYAYQEMVQAIPRIAQEVFSQ